MIIRTDSAARCRVLLHGYYNNTVDFVVRQLSSKIENTGIMYIPEEFKIIIGVKDNTKVSQVYGCILDTILELFSTFDISNYININNVYHKEDLDFLHEVKMLNKRHISLLYNVTTTHDSVIIYL